MRPALTPAWLGPVGRSPPLTPSWLPTTEAAEPLTGNQEASASGAPPLGLSFPIYNVGHLKALLEVALHPPIQASGTQSGEMGPWKRGERGGPGSQDRAGWLHQEAHSFEASLCTEGSQIFLERLALLGCDSLMQLTKISVF